MKLVSYDLKIDYERAGAISGNEPAVLDAYLLDISPEFMLQTRKAVIICPGGGYNHLSAREAEPVAMRFLAAGVQAFVLKYSVTPARYPAALLEAAEAVRLVRHRATEFCIDPAQIIICGFSAGGHLAASLGTLWDSELLQTYMSSTPDAVSMTAPSSNNCSIQDWTPNGMILNYPVITGGEFAHTGSFRELLGEREHTSLRAHLSLETQVTSATPPAFIWHTFEDNAVPVENALLFSMSLRRHNIPFELHIYEKGVHGLSLCDETTSAAPNQLLPDNQDWITLAIQWLKRLS